MNNTFVAEVCAKILKKHAPQELLNVVIVVPSQRVGLHLKKELSNTIKSAIVLPQIITVDQFLTKKHKLVVLDSLRSKFELYDAYQKISDSEETFDSFQSWAGQILGDFNDIDKNLLNTKEVFSNLRDIKEIETWSFNSEELSDSQKRFLQFWDSLGKLYTIYNAQLAEKGYISSGGVYRYYAEHPLELIQLTENKPHYFIAFNALSKSEEQILKSLHNANIATIIWDADQYYIANKQQEAGQFIRTYQAWSNFKTKELSNSLKSADKNIKVYGAKTNIDQVNIVSKLLHDNPDFSQSKSALVFGDESLLKATLNVLPQSIKKMNIAMGYPLQDSYAFNLLNQLFKTLRNIARYKNKSYIYYKDFDAIFSQELVGDYLNAKNLDLNPIFYKVKKENYTYIPKSMLEDHFDVFFNDFSFLFFDKAHTVIAVLEKIINLFQSIRTYYIQQELDLIETEALTKICVSLDRIKILLNEYPYIETLEGLSVITGSLLAKESISFYGEPLSGLQVLGLLETRGLDFENVILMSCNEDVIPRASFVDSLMPFDLRNYFGLPNKSDKEAMYAYYFYRLIQRARNVYLIYNNGVSDKLTSNEISRYILQLEKELMPMLGKRLETENFFFPQSTSAKFNVVTKGKTELNRIKEFFKMGISASAINTYNTCPLDFYFSYLTRLNDKKYVEEDIESSTYGSIVHKVLELLYLSAGKMITSDKLEVMKQTYTTLLDTEFTKVFPSGNYKEGKNLLLYKMAETSIVNFLRNELQLIKTFGAIEILGLEKNYTYNLDIKTDYGIIPILLKGNIDRIDRIGGKIRIIDYKTGMVESKDLRSDQALNRKNHKSFQLLFYCYLFAQTENQNKLQTGIISMRNLGAGFISLQNKDKTPFEELTADIKQDFEEYLSELISEMLNLSVPFKHNPKSEYCEMCS